MIEINNSHNKAKKFFMLSKYHFYVFLLLTPMLWDIEMHALVCLLVVISYNFFNELIT